MYSADSAAPPPYAAHGLADGSKSYQQQIPPPIPQYTHTTVIQPVYGMASFGHHPVQMQCPRCNQQILTNVRHDVGGGTWLIAAIICIFGGIFGCCLIPFCSSTCQDAVHTCPSCNALVGNRRLL